ncbi:carboxypeptidase-like regulatory domain-containing protein [Chitinivibrio alkaliphilus]|uniref:Carboxypeptidase regulatory-like domain-containing protein n=1 Tax=Chitinivibrio alkaliphilus ACht1 TaxID=1313304 RepID=U7D626_9BACT|nr:carboxypeptidase-like regulatory domain-containing protein [Chitinivibrio alkaliphilus]ERP31388.1 hypothetical protein CALK_1737 [Chitinivibrio alkaliphilus ACht1]
MRHIFGVCILLLLISCSLDMAGGNTSETTNGRVAVVDAGGDPVAHAEVALRRSSYTPISDPQGHQVIRAKTNERGFADFAEILPGEYTLTSRSDAGDRGLRSSILFTVEEEAQAVVRLDRPGSLYLDISSDYVDDSGVVYIAGTSYAERVQSSRDGAVRTVRFDSLPSGVLPPLWYSSEQAETPQLLLRGVEIMPDEETALFLDTVDAIRPLWEFSFTSRVSRDVIAGFSGDSAEFAQNIRTKLHRAEDVFNMDQLFDGEFRFILDTVLLFTEGSTFDTLGHGSDYFIDYHLEDPGVRTVDRLIALRGIVSYGDSPDRFFSEEFIEGSISLLAQLRGAYPLSSENISKEKNRVYSNVEFYHDETTYVDAPFSANRWHEVNFYGINSNGARVGGERDFLTRAIPERVSLTVRRNGDGTPISGATVEVFPLRYLDGVLENRVVFSGESNSDGVVSFSGDVYTEDGEIAYTNLFLRCTVDDQVFLRVLPLSHALTQYLQEGSSDFTSTIFLDIPLE